MKSPNVQIQIVADASEIRGEFKKYQFEIKYQKLSINLFEIFEVYRSLARMKRKKHWLFL